MFVSYYKCSVALVRAYIHLTCLCMCQKQDTDNSKEPDTEMHVEQKTTCLQQIVFVILSYCWCWGRCVFLSFAMIFSWKPSVMCSILPCSCPFYPTSEGLSLWKTFLYTFIVYLVLAYLDCLTPSYLTLSWREERRDSGEWESKEMRCEDRWGDVRKREVMKGDERRWKEMKGDESWWKEMEGDERRWEEMKGDEWRWGDERRWKEMNGDEWRCKEMQEDARRWMEMKGDERRWKEMNGDERRWEEKRGEILHYLLCLHLLTLPLRSLMLITLAYLTLTLLLRRG